MSAILWRVFVCVIVHLPPSYLAEFSISEQPGWQISFNPSSDPGCRVSCLHFILLFTFLSLLCRHFPKINVSPFYNENTTFVPSSNTTGQLAIPAAPLFAEPTELDQVGFSRLIAH